jgi:peptidoglycan/xylan/chitin deacetylase (PgdA/CDA1 family)
MWLARQFSVRPLRDLLTGPSDARAVALTFDDGYASWDEIVWPVLDELGLPATFFVCSGFVGLAPDAAAAFTRTRLLRRQTLRPLTAAQLRRLADEPRFEIGSHTVHHADLSVLQRVEDVTVEIAGDRRRLEDLTGRSVTLFAYPFGQAGHATALARRVLEGAGFEWAFTIVPQCVDAAAGRFDVGRDSLDLADSEALWASWLAGGYDALYRTSRRGRAG